MKEWKGREKGKKLARTLNTWDKGWEIPYGEEASSIQTLERFADWDSRAAGPSLRKMPEDVCVERAFRSHEVAPKLGLDETVELLTRVVDAGEEDPNLRTLSAALKATLPPPPLPCRLELSY